MRTCLALLMVLLLCCPFGALAELGSLLTENQTVLDLDAAHIRLTSGAELDALLSKHPALREVRLYESSLPREDMEALFTKYPQVFFGFTLRFATHTVRTDATSFSTLHYSQLKDPKDRYHTSEELSQLRMCTRLKALDLGHNKLTDLTFLEGLSDLRVLIISPNYGLSDLSPLAKLTKLEYLEAFSTKTRDVAMLSGLTQLRDLNLSNSKLLGDIRCLSTLPKLERFWCAGSAVPRKQQKAFQSAMPDCQCVWTGQPTSGGWRKHPRYEVIHAIFSEGVYRPFEE